MSAGVCLKWNDFQENVSRSFSRLRNSSDFQDVTLVGDDHQRLAAHRIILSTCSEYFREVLRGNEENKPLLCLENVSIRDLESVLDYIYHGETQVEQRYVQRFLKLAQRFKLEGLQDATVEEDSKYFESGYEKSKIKDSKTKPRFKDKPMENKSTPVHSEFHGDLFPPPGSRDRKDISRAWKFGGLKKDSDGNILTDTMFCALCNWEKRYASSPGGLLAHLNHNHMDLMFKAQTQHVKVNDIAGTYQPMLNELTFLEETSPVHSKFHGDLFPPQGSKNRNNISRAWKFGGLKKDSDGNILTDTVFCALCPKSMKYNFSPGGLQDHIKHNHKGIIGQEQTDSELIEEKEEPSDTEATVENHLEDLKEFDNKLQKYYEQMGSSLWQCLLCPQSYKRKRLIKEHVEYHIDGLQFQCHICVNTFKSKKELRYHDCNV